MALFTFLSLLESKLIMFGIVNQLTTHKFFALSRILVVNYIFLLTSIWMRYLKWSKMKVKLNLSTLNLLTLFTFLFSSFSKKLLKIVKPLMHTRNLIVLQASDIVMTWTVIQSNLSKKKFTKLCYAVRYPYQNYPQHW